MTQDTLELNQIEINQSVNFNIDFNIDQIDNKLSNRFIALDPAGYFIIYIDPTQNLICAKHFTNEIDERGLAVDPETGKVIPAKGKTKREPNMVFQAYTAKQLCVKIFEDPEVLKNQLTLITMFDHAAYIGREAQKAEWALRHHQEYVQD